MSLLSYPWLSENTREIFFIILSIFHKYQNINSVSLDNHPVLHVIFCFYSFSELFRYTIQRQSYQNIGHTTILIFLGVFMISNLGCYR